MGNIVNARVEAIQPLTASILQLTLSPETYIDYSAGQYLQILPRSLINQFALSGKALSEKQKNSIEEYALSYSIANAPLGAQKYELHIRHSQDNSKTQMLIEEIKQYSSLTLYVPHGECHLGKICADKPILFIAGGTGIAPIKAMIEQLLVEGEQRPFVLYWIARSHSDLYMDEKLLYWQKHIPNFKYFSVLSDSTQERLSNLILKQHQANIQQWQFVLSGPFDMVYIVRDTLVTAGANPAYMYSDAFERL